MAAQPPSLLRGDLSGSLPQVLAQVPAGVTPVVFHSAVLAYLPLEDREAFVRQVRAAGARWVSNEGAGILPEITAKLPDGDGDGDRTAFVLALDGEPIARTGPHGQYARAL